LTSEIRKTTQGIPQTNIIDSSFFTESSDVVNTFLMLVNLSLAEDQIKFNYDSNITSTTFINGYYVLYTVKPVLRGRIWEKEKVVI